MPNQADITASSAQRAGHAIHLIGWDDNLEVTKRDGQGNDLLDARGNPIKEKGFYLFKNSWGTASFGVEHPTGPGYGWISYEYINRYGSAVVAELPILSAAEVCDDAAQADEDRDGKANCQDTQCSAHPACTGSGTTPRTYTASPNAAIPDNSSTGASSTITVTDVGSLTDLKVTVDITHTYRGDLKVTLSKGAFTKVLVGGVGGAADHLMQTFTVGGIAGQSLAGAWTLKVEDTARTDVGTFKSWKLEATTN
jgi:hypothetical protein